MDEAQEFMAMYEEWFRDPGDAIQCRLDGPGGMHQSLGDLVSAGAPRASFSPPPPALIVSPRTAAFNAGLMVPLSSPLWQSPAAPEPQHAANLAQLWPAQALPIPPVAPTADAPHSTGNQTAITHPSAGQQYFQQATAHVSQSTCTGRGAGCDTVQGPEDGNSNTTLMKVTAAQSTSSNKAGTTVTGPATPEQPITPIVTNDEQHPSTHTLLLATDHHPTNVSAFAAAQHTHAHVQQPHRVLSTSMGSGCDGSVRVDSQEVRCDEVAAALVAGLPCGSDLTSASSQTLARSASHITRSSDGSLVPAVSGRYYKESPTSALSPRTSTACDLSKLSSQPPKVVLDAGNTPAGGRKAPGSWVAPGQPASWQPLVVKPVKPVNNQHQQPPHPPATTHQSQQHVQPLQQPSSRHYQGQQYACQYEHIPQEAGFSGGDSGMHMSAVEPAPVPATCVLAPGEQQQQCVEAQQQQHGQQQQQYARPVVMSHPPDYQAPPCDTSSPVPAALPPAHYLPACPQQSDAPAPAAPQHYYHPLSQPQHLQQQHVSEPVAEVTGRDVRQGVGQLPQAVKLLHPPPPMMLNGSHPASYSAPGGYQADHSRELQRGRVVHRWSCAAASEPPGGDTFTMSQPGDQPPGAAVVQPSHQGPAVIRLSAEQASDVLAGRVTLVPHRMPPTRAHHCPDTSSHAADLPVMYEQLHQRGNQQQQGQQWYGGPQAAQYVYDGTPGQWYAPAVVEPVAEQQQADWAGPHHQHQQPQVSVVSYQPSTPPCGPAGAGQALIQQPTVVYVTSGGDGIWQPHMQRTAPQVHIRPYPPPLPSTNPHQQHQQLHGGSGAEPRYQWHSPSVVPNLWVASDQVGPGGGVTATAMGKAAGVMVVVADVAEDDASGWSQVAANEQQEQQRVVGQVVQCSRPPAGSKRLHPEQQRYSGNSSWEPQHTDVTPHTTSITITHPTSAQLASRFPSMYQQPPAAMVPKPAQHSGGGRQQQQQQAGKRYLPDPQQQHWHTGGVYGVAPPHQPYKRIMCTQPAVQGHTHQVWVPVTHQPPASCQAPDLNHAPELPHSFSLPGPVQLAGLEGTSHQDNAQA